MIRIQLILSLLFVLFIVSGCTGPSPTSTVMIMLPTPTATIPPTATLAPTLTPTPAPKAKGGWECDPSGGLACFDSFAALTMASADEGWATTRRGNVFHYTTQPGDTMAAWHQLDPEVAIPFHKLVMVSPTEGWAIGTSMEAPFVHYKDGQWSSVPGWCCASDLDMVSPDEGWAVGSQGTIVHYTQGQWQVVVEAARGQQDLRSVVMLSPGEGWAAGSNKTLLHYDGQQWQQVDTRALPYFTSLREMEQVNNGEIWATGYDGIFLYRNGSWQRFFEAPTGDLSMISPKEGWAIGETGIFYHYQNDIWQAVPSPTSYPLFAIDMINSEEGWAVGENSTILHYYNGQWQVVDEAAPPPKLTAIAWPDGGEPWAVGNDGFWRYTNGAWQQVAVPPEVGGARALEMVSPEEGWAVGVYGKILHYTQDGWQLASSPTSKHISDIDMTQCATLFSKIKPVNHQGQGAYVPTAG